MPQFVRTWLGALLVPILGLTEAGRWDGMVAKITSRFTGHFTNLCSTPGSFSDNPMGIHWTGMRDLLRFICERGFGHHVAANLRSLAGAARAAAPKYLRCDVYWHAKGEAQ